MGTSRNRGRWGTAALLAASVAACGDAFTAGSPDSGGAADGSFEAAVQDATSPDSGGSDDSSAADASADAPGDGPAHVESGADVTPPPDAGACNPTKPFGAASPVNELDSTTGGQDATLRFASGFLAAVFESDRAGGVGGLDLYSTSRPDLQTTFGTALDLVTLNTAADEEAPTLTGDALTIYFATTRTGPMRIFQATRTTASLAFGAPAQVTSLNTLGNLRQPYVREDGAVLYFTADAAEAGNFDVYRSSKSGGTSLQTAVPVGELTTTSEEAFPVVTADDLTIYWASTRTDGGARGGLDIWMATRSSTSAQFGSFTDVSELETTADEYPSAVTPDGCTLYFSSTRPSGTSFKLFVATRGK